jgi:hypothetical protein
MVKLRNIGPMTVEAVEMAYRFANAVPEHDLKEWLEKLPNAGSRLRALDRLLDDDALYTTCSAPEQQQVFRVANEVVRTIISLCRDREQSLDEMVDELMHGSSAQLSHEGRRARKIYLRISVWETSRDTPRYQERCAS